MCLRDYKNMTFTKLVKTIYTITRIDKIRYDINIHFVTEPSNSLPASKFLIKDVYCVTFIMFDKSRYKIMHVDTIYKDVRVSNVHNYPQNQLPSYNGGNQYSDIFIPLTSARSPLWNDDFGIYGMVGLSNDVAHTDDGDNEIDDNHTNDGDNETDDNYDDSGGGDDKGGASLEYSEVRFSSSQFEDNPLQGNWIVLGVKNYAIEVMQPEMSTPY